MKLFTFRETLRRIVSEEWGQTFSTKEEADQALIDDNSQIMAVAVMELIDRFNQFVFHMGAVEESQRRDCSMSVDEDDKVFPNLKIGDSLWSGDIETGISRYIVTANGEKTIVIPCHDKGRTYAYRTRYASNWMRESLAECIEEAARETLSHAERAVLRAKAAIQDVAEGGDLMKYVGDLELENEADEN